jgi:purine-binding chemotaxis protein CheW
MDTKKYLIFEVKNQSYAVTIRNVKEIIRMVEVSPLPMSKSSIGDNTIEGAIFLRGEVISIFSMAKQLGYDYVSSVNSKDKILIADINGNNFGFIIDEVREVREIEEKSLQDPQGEICHTGKVEKIFIENNEIFSVINIERCLIDC